MKSKKITYLLVVGVVAVWGIIFYRIYVAVGEETVPPVYVPTKKTVYFNAVNHQNEVFNINAVYRDPFLPAQLDEPEKEYVAPPVTVKMAPMPSAATPSINWTTIVYKGYIANPTNKQRIAIILVNGAEAMLAVGQSAHGLQLLKNLGDSVQVKYKNKITYIRLN